MTDEFSYAFHAALERVDVIARGRTSRKLGEALGRSQAAAHVISSATPLFARAFARLQAEGFVAQRLRNPNRGMTGNRTEPVIATGDEGRSWGQLEHSFGPFHDMGNYITSTGAFFASVQVSLNTRHPSDATPIYHDLVPPPNATSDPANSAWVQWYRLEDAIEAQARYLATLVRPIPDLSQIHSRDLIGGILIVEQSTGAIHFVWDESRTRNLGTPSTAGVYGNERSAPFQPGSPFRDTDCRLETLDDYVARLVARKIVLSGSRR